MSIRVCCLLVVLLLAHEAVGDSGRRHSYPGTEPLTFAPTKRGRFKSIVEQLRKIGRPLGKVGGPIKDVALVIGKPLRELTTTAGDLQRKWRYNLLTFNDRVVAKAPPRAKRAYNALRCVSPFSISSFLGKKLAEDRITTWYAKATVAWAASVRGSLMCGLIGLPLAGKIEAFTYMTDIAVLGTRTLQVHGVKGVLRLFPEYLKHNRMDRELLRWYGDTFIKPAATTEKQVDGPSAQQPLGDELSSPAARKASVGD